jgi:hypothetical protein
MFVSSLKMANHRSHFKNHVLINPSKYCICTGPRKFHNDSMGSSKGPARLRRNLPPRLEETAANVDPQSAGLNTFCKVHTEDVSGTTVYSVSRPF